MTTIADVQAGQFFTSPGVSVTAPGAEPRDTVFQMTEDSQGSFVNWRTCVTAEGIRVGLTANRAAVIVEGFDA